MRAGLLRHEITIQENVPNQNTYGEDVDYWTTFITRRARVSPMQATERWTTQQLLPEVTHEIEVRHGAGVRSDMRVLFGTRVFTIEGPPIDPDERGIRTILHCREQPSQEAN